jgi:predicted translin family RNA/ssDNA-binding protein
MNEKNIEEIIEKRLKELNIQYDQIEKKLNKLNMQLDQIEKIFNESPFCKEEKRQEYYNASYKP